MANIVISYRREDSKWITGRIFDRLEGHFGSGHVFMDIDNIPIGSDFRDHLRDILKSCDILIVVVGPDWLKPDASGRPRIHEETDWVRMEISAALEKKVPVVPLLVDGTPMPRPEQLPRDLQGFAYRHAATVDTGVDFRGNMQRLTNGLDRLLAVRQAPVVPQSRPPQIFEPAVTLVSPATTNHEAKQAVETEPVADDDPSAGFGGTVPGPRTGEVERTQEIAAVEAEPASAPTSPVARLRPSPAKALLIVIPVLLLLATLIWRAQNIRPEENASDLTPDRPSSNSYERVVSAVPFTGDPLEGNWCEMIGSDLFPPSQIKKLSDGAYAANFYAISTTRRRGSTDFVSSDNALRLALKQTDQDTLEGSKIRSTSQVNVRFVRCS